MQTLLLFFSDKIRDIIRDSTLNSGTKNGKTSVFNLTMAGTVLNYTSGASINGMGRDYVGVTQPSPVDSDLMIETDTLTNQTNVKIKLEAKLSNKQN